FQNVFLKEFRTELALGAGVGVVAFAFLFANFRFALRGATLPVMVGVRGQPETRIDLTRFVRRLVWPASVLLAVILGLSASGGWLTVLRLLHATPFGVADPLFHRDLSYYVFTMPVISAGLTLVSTLAVFS